MYNTDFLPQLEEFIIYLEGVSGKTYTSKLNVEILPCHEDINGEWVPNTVEAISSELEKKFVHNR